MIIKTTNSICPICLKKLPAVLERDEGEGEIWLCKTCPEHGSFKALVRKGCFDREEWTAGQAELKKDEKTTAPAIVTAAAAIFRMRAV